MRITRLGPLFAFGFLLSACYSASTSFNLSNPHEAGEHKP